MFRCFLQPLTEQRSYPDGFCQCFLVTVISGVTVFSEDDELSLEELLRLKLLLLLSNISSLTNFRGSAVWILDFISFVFLSHDFISSFDGSMVDVFTGSPNASCNLCSSSR